MVTEHCVLMAQGPCDGRCGTCERRMTSHSLRDRKGYEFPVMTDITGRSHVYNSVRLDLTAAMSEIVSTGLDALRLDVHTESVSAACAAVASVRAALNSALAGRAPNGGPRPRTTTSGHFFRGVG